MMMCGFGCRALPLILPAPTLAPCRVGPASRDHTTTSTVIIFHLKKLGRSANSALVDPHSDPPKQPHPAPAPSRAVELFRCEIPGEAGGFGTTSSPVSC